jgi:hypothetical protein
MRAPRYAAIGLVALTASAHAVEQNALSPDTSADNALAIYHSTRRNSSNRANRIPTATASKTAIA